LEEIDIWRTAAFLMREHGEGASLNAAQRADALLAMDDEIGEGVWTQVVHAIGQLEQQKRTMVRR
jgi:hypothetical protein